MVNEYQQRFYLPAVQRQRELLADGASEAKRLSVFHKRLKDRWKELHIEIPESDHEGPFQVEDTFTVSAVANLGDLKPEEVDVELYYGRMKGADELEKGYTQNMDMVEDRGDGSYLFRCTVTCRDSGRYGFTVRIGPHADDWIRFTPGLLTWA